LRVIKSTWLRSAARPLFQVVVYKRYRNKGGGLTIWWNITGQFIWKIVFTIIWISQ